MTQFDKQILENLWKWKFLTTAAIAEFHFPDLSSAYAHRRLLRLKKARLINWLHIDGDGNGKSFAWSLSLNGFEAIRSDLPDLYEAGFKSESPEHDLLVTAIHLGEWIYGLPKGCDLCTEQELRRLHKGQHEDWVPQTTIRRTDGYWLTQFDGKPGVVALEVENSRKSPAEYREIAQFYDNRPELFRVVWLVKKDSTARAIYNSVQEGKGGKRLHNFIRVKDFVEHGWGALFFLGRDVGKPLTRLLLPESATSKRHVASTLILNALKSPHRSTKYTALRAIAKSHRLGISLVAPTPTSSSSLPSTHLTKGVPTNEN